MISKETYCYRILKTYSLIVDFDGKPPRENVRAPVEGETYKQWKERVLGNTVTDVVIYAPIDPGPQRKISTLQNLAGAEHLEKMFKTVEKTKDKQKTDAIDKAVTNTKKSLTSFPKDDLEILRDELGDTLELPVQQFLDRFLKSARTEIDTEELLRALLSTYNNVVSMYRKRMYRKLG
jgi:hypothetical protein